MTKRVISFLFFSLLLFCNVSAVAASEYNYLYQELEFSAIADEGRYDDLIQSVKDFQAEHRYLMPDEWVQKISDSAILAKNAIVSELHSEYDPFEDIELKWFGDHKAVGPNEPYALFDGTNGLVLSFYLPVDSFIYIKSFTALLNGSERIKGSVDNWDSKYIESNKYESFRISISILDNSDVDVFNSLAFRFYGKNEDEHIDIFINDETVDYLRRIRAQKASARNVKDVLWAWMKAVDSIIDTKIIPAWAAKIISKYPELTYPDNVRTADYWRFFEITESSIKDLDNNIGRVYYFHCKINRVHEKDNNSNAYWFVDISNAYGKYLTSAYIILDHAVANKGMDPDRYSVGDGINIAAAYAGTDIRYRQLFILGSDYDAVSIAQNALKGE